MSNIFNDLNKMVNTIQKVDKLLSEKPKTEKTQYFTRRFTESELDYLYLTIKKIERDYDVDAECKKIHKHLLKKLVSS